MKVVQTQQLQAIELKVNDLEDFAADSQAAYSKLNKTVNYLQDKVDDLETRARQNNLLLIGILESVKAPDRLTL